MNDTVRQLSDWLRDTDIAALDLRGPGVHVRLQRAGADIVPAAAEHAAATARTVVRAGSVGVLRLSHPLREQPLVRAGQRVAAGQPLALLQIGAVLLPVPAPRAGVVARVLATPGQAVGYGDPLFELD